MRVYRITVVQSKYKYRYSFLSIGFKSSADAMLNAMKAFGDAPKLIKVEAMK